MGGGRGHGRPVNERPPAAKQHRPELLSDNPTGSSPLANLAAAAEQVGFVEDVAPAPSASEVLNDERVQAQQEDEEEGFSAQHATFDLPAAEIGYEAEGEANGDDNADDGGSALLPLTGPKYPFHANYNDHFETQTTALRHLVPALRALQEATKPLLPDEFALYDPYYCEGSVKAKWENLGFPKVLHECRDFYDDVKRGFVPNYDILVTNPPYSADHIPRLLDILVTRKQPFALLVPDYVAKKPFYTEILQRCFTPTTLYQKPGVLKKTTYTASGAPSSSAGAAGASSQRSVDFSSHPLLAGLNLQQQQQRPAAYVPPAPRPPPVVPTAGEDSEGEDTDDDDADTKEPKKDGAAAPSAPKPKKKRERYAAKKRAKREPLGTEPFYIVPRNWYDYDHPRGTGNAHSHFRSMWIVWGGPRHSEVLLATRAAHAPSEHLKDGVYVFSGLIELEHRGKLEVNTQRANPTRRAARGGGGGSGGGFSK